MQIKSTESTAANETLYPDSTEWEFGLNKRALAMGNESETGKITVLVEKEGLTSKLFE
jgi:hypothetical protein